MPTYSSGEMQVGAKDREINDFFDIIYEVENAFHKETNKARNGRLSATSGAGFCSLWSTKIATEDVFEKLHACNEYWFKFGNMSEEVYIQAMINRGYYISDQIRLTENSPLTKDLKLGGYLDILVKDHNDKLLIIEKKTCGSQMPNKPKNIHLTQLGLYMAWYALDGALAYQSRLIGGFFGDLKGKQFYIPYSRQEAVNLMTKVFYARLCIDNNITPNQPLLLTKANCNEARCPFVDQCHRHAESTTKFDTVTDDEEATFMNEACEMAEEFMSQKNIDIRRNDLFEKTNIERQNRNQEPISKRKFNKMLY